MFKIMQIAREYGVVVHASTRPKAGKQEESSFTPLSRDQSIEAAREFALQHPVPLRLVRGVKVLSFGQPSIATTVDNLVMLNYRSRWTDKSGVMFESRIEEHESGVSYNVYLIEKNHSTGKSLRYFVSRGSNPDEVWARVVERQRQAMTRDTVEAQEQSEVPSSPGGSRSGIVDSVLSRVTDLKSMDVWGLERYGFMDLTCRKAMEGQPGVEDSQYQYVNQRHGWVQETIKLRNMISERGKKKMQLKTAASRKPQVDKRSAAEEKVVARLVDTMVKRVCIKHEKENSKRLKQEQKRLDKERKRLERSRYVAVSWFWRTWVGGALLLSNAVRLREHRAVCFDEFETYHCCFTEGNRKKLLQNAKPW